MQLILDLILQHGNKYIFTYIRVTVQVDLPGKNNIQIDVIASKCNRSTLHVQSISFWAAANIGPYAQANAIGNVVFMAGQIGLVPHTMELSPLLTDQIQASLHNLQAINKEMKSFPLGAVCYITDPQAYSEVYSEWNNRSILLTVSCSALPRSALVEWQTLNQKVIHYNNVAIDQIGA
jgi:diphthine-ammonia ligase